MACPWQIPVAEIQVDNLRTTKQEKAELGILEEMLCSSLYMQTGSPHRAMQSRHRHLSSPVWTISKGKPFQKLATPNFFSSLVFPICLLHCHFWKHWKRQAYSWKEYVGRCKTKQHTANCRAWKVCSSFWACQDRTNFCLYSCSFYQNR